MQPEPDATAIARIAERVGITPEQVRAVLTAAGSREEVATARSTRDAIPPAAAWAAAGVALVAMFVFIAATDGFDSRPDGKAAALATGVLFSAAALRLAMLARRRGFLLGEQVGLSVVAIISPVVTWSVLWLLGLWPGRPGAAGGPGPGEWVSGSQSEVAAAVLVVCLTPLVISWWALRRTGAELSMGVALLAAHGVVAALLALTGIPAPGPVLGAMLAGAYTAAFVAAGCRLERRRPGWARWVHPFGVLGAFWFVSLTAQAFGSGAGLVLGAAMLVAGALLTISFARGIHLAATVVGGAIWDFWLYAELALGPVAGLTLTLTLGLGAIAVGVIAWRRRAGARGAALVS